VFGQRLKQFAGLFWAQGDAITWRTRIVFEIRIERRYLSWPVLPIAGRRPEAEYEAAKTPGEWK
jgi:hypothetical protein